MYETTRKANEDLHDGEEFILEEVNALAEYCRAKNWELSEEDQQIIANQRT